MKNNALFSAGNLESFIFVSTPWPHSIPSKRLKGWKLQGERHSRKQITNCFTCKQPCWDHAASPESEQADTIPPRDELFWSSSRLEHEEHRSQQMFKPYSPSPPSSKGIFLFCFFFFFPLASHSRTPQRCHMSSKLGFKGITAASTQKSDAFRLAGKVIYKKKSKQKTPLFKKFTHFKVYF